MNHLGGGGGHPQYKVLAFNIIIAHLSILRYCNFVPKVLAGRGGGGLSSALSMIRNWLLKMAAREFCDERKNTSDYRSAEIPVEKMAKSLLRHH